MKLFGSTANEISNVMKNKSDEKCILEITEVILVHRSIISKDY